MARERFVLLGVARARSLWFRAVAQWSTSAALPGEHFWAIAEQVLHQAWGRPPSDAETTPYWQRLVAANRDRLADPGNADFIRPGDEYRIPPPPAGPRARD